MNIGSIVQVEGEYIRPDPVKYSDLAPCVQSLLNRLAVEIEEHHPDMVHVLITMNDVQQETVALSFFATRWTERGKN